MPKSTDPKYNVLILIQQYQHPLLRICYNNHKQAICVPNPCVRERTRHIKPTLFHNLTSWEAK